MIGGGERANRSRNYSTCALARMEAGLSVALGQDGAR